MRELNLKKQNITIKLNEGVEHLIDIVDKFPLSYSNTTDASIRKSMDYILYRKIIKEIHESHNQLNFFVNHKMGRKSY